jgi:hypothetical protein
VADGIYKPAYQASFRVYNSPRHATFEVQAGLEVYGGFGGYDPTGPGEQVREDRAKLYERTILSGDLDGDPGETAFDAFHVVSVQGGGGLDPTVFDGFVLEYGNADDSLNPGAQTVARGGGLRAVSVDDLTLENLKFRNNKAMQGGGAYFSDGICKIKFCVFENNSAYESGGGAYLISLESDTVLPGLSNSGVFNSIFRNNATRLILRSDLTPSGSLSLGGGIYARDLGSPPLTFSNLLIHDNQAGLGGGAFLSTPGGFPTIWVNCTVAYNTATAIGVGGGGGPGTDPEGAGVYLDTQSLTHEFHNMIVWNNVANTPSVAEGIALRPGAAVPVVTYSIVQSSLTAGWGTQNKFGAGADPLFVSPTERNLRLSFGSPGIDQGDNASVVDDLVDLDGDGNISEEVPWCYVAGSFRRTATTNAPDHPLQTAPVVDIGAHEAPAEMIAQ